MAPLERVPKQGGILKSMPSPRNRQIDLSPWMEEVRAVHVDTEGPSLAFADPRLRVGSRDRAVGAGDDVQQHFIAEMLHHFDLEDGRVLPAFAVRKQMEMLLPHTEHDRGAARPPHFGGPTVGERNPEPGGAIHE